MSRTNQFPPPNRPLQDGTNPAVRPLQINRPAQRSNTPGTAGSPARGAALPSNPARPQRSELRTRQPSEFSEGSSSYRDNRDSIGTSYSEAAPTQRPRPANRNRPGPPTEPPNSPPAMNSVLSAFQAQGTRRRGKTQDDIDYEEERRREREVDARRQERMRDKATGKRTNGKARTGDIDAILDQIRDEWEDVIDPDFNNVDLALQLLEPQASGKSMSSFRDTKHLLSNALKGSVDKHYQAFAAAIPHHASLINHLGASQTQITDARMSLQEARESLGNKRADLAQLWSRGQALEDMMRLLDQIEHLKSVPDVLETLMSEKRLLQAAVLLVHSMKMINKQDMAEIGALGDLRGYLNSQETALREILVDELHSHLYLKSFWCESRWAAYAPNQQSFPKVEFEQEGAAPFINHGEASPMSPGGFHSTRLSRHINDLKTRPNDSPRELDECAFGNGSARGSMFLDGGNSTASAFQSEAQRNPESDSFAYMENVLESLAVLGKLGSALDVVAQRLPSEVFTLVETTLEEVSERAEYGRRASVYAPVALAGGTRTDGVYVFTVADGVPGVVPVVGGGLMSSSSLRLTALESSAKRVDHETLKDFFWTTYSKLDAVAQGVRVIYEVANRIGSRRDFKDSSGTKPGALFPVAEIWMPVQTEVRTLLYDYLTDEEQSSVSGRNPISSINEVLREGKFSRDQTKPVFRFADTDLKSTAKALRTHEEELMRVLKETMPGLVQGSSENAAQATLSTVGTDDRLLGAGQHHRLLIKPDAFHVSVLFQPTLAFLDRVTEILPSGLESARSSHLVLDEFVLKVYLPQLEDKVLQLCHHAVTGPEAFQHDPSSTKLCAEPLVKASTQLMALINSLCAMLQTTPFHRENYARLILGVIIQFYQRCSDRFQELISLKPDETDGERPLALAAQWAQRQNLSNCMTELLNTPETDPTKRINLCRQQTQIEMELLNDAGINRRELVPSVRNLSALCSLYRSIAWFAAELNALKTTRDDVSLSPNTPMMTAATPMPYTPYIPVMPATQPHMVLQLPLSKEMSMRFQALLKTYEQLGNMILDTVRIDVRCRTIHYMDSAMRHGNYVIDREASEPDPHVVDINTDLGQFDDFVSATLPPKEQRFIFAGLGQLMEHLLIHDAKNIPLANAFGIKKMMRNMLALQQSIKTIANEPSATEFERAKQYYGLFSLTPAEVVQSVRDERVFSYEEYQVMLKLICGVNQAQGEDGVARAADRKYSSYAVELLEMSSSDS